MMLMILAPGRPVTSTPLLLLASGCWTEAGMLLAWVAAGF